NRCSRSSEISAHDPLKSALTIPRNAHIMDGPSGSDGAVSAKPSVAGDVEVADSSAPPTLEKSETVGWSTRL
ncbi:hypothetical protein, partial [Bradyrhizobium liaoningense]|uniref:hypothetical protein n=1 Tax=Bradyrhizobium liaoningense TaxID=43992 RepID=UPI001BACE1F2